MMSIHDKIEKSLKDAILSHNEGMSANEAVAKTASQNELNPETICRVVEAFNIAKTRAFIKKATVRDADFDTADKAVVIKMVFGAAPQEAKTASVPSWSFSFKKKTEEEVEKTAEEVLVEDQIKVVKLSKIASEAEIQNLRGDVMSAEYSFVRGLNKAADHFSYSYNAEKAEETLDPVVYQYLENKLAMDTLNLITKCAGLDYVVRDDLPPQNYGEQDFHELFDSVVDDAEDYAEKVAKHNAAVEQYDKGDFDTTIDRIGGIHEEKFASDFLFGGAPKPKHRKYSPLPENIVDKIAQDLFPSKEASVKEEVKPSALQFLKFGAAEVPIKVGPLDVGKIPLFDTVSSGDGPKDLISKGYELRLRGDMSASAKDEVDMEFENAQRQAILRDLIQNDEIISTYDPQVVIEAYNTMSKLAPKGSLMPDVARSVLRYATAQTIDPHYATQLAELENTITKNQAGNDKRV